jgi:hypothetical protein
MFGSAALEVAAGLILIFLLMSLIMTIVQETLQGFFNTRARMLEQALLELLQGKADVRDDFYNHPLIYALYRTQRTPGSTEPPTPAQLPSYIPRETFAATFLDLVKQAKSPEIAQALASLKQVAGDDAAALRREIEAWYDAAMDRISGAFKRRSQASLFFLGLAAAVLLNVNAIAIAQFLAVSPQQRQLVTAIAQKAIEARPAPAPQAQPSGGSATPAANAAAPAEAPTNGATPAEAPGNEATPAEAPGNAGAAAESPGDATSPVNEAQVRELTNQLVETGMPLGWNPVSRHWLERGFPDRRIVLFQGPFSLAALFAWLLLIAGYLVTAFAVMLGAPFWFDMLNKIMVIRATVKPREKSPDEASEDRGGGRTRRQGS